MYHSIVELRKGSGQSPYRLWYNEWVRNNTEGMTLDVGKSKFWDYGFPTIDKNPKLNPTFCLDIEDTGWKDNLFHTILCNGMYECVKDPQKMVDEVYRLLFGGGVAIFGFVGKDYPPYKKDWKYYHNNIDFKDFEIIERKDFNKEYHFIVCQKP